jgi:diguanylate cyclase (GGDEF)-like protein
VKTPLGGARGAAAAFGLLATGAPLLQMDHTLPTGRAVLAFGAVALLMAEITQVYLRGRASWLGIIVVGPLLIAAGQGLAVPLAASAFALAAIAAHSMYGSRRMVAVCVLDIVASLVSLAMLERLIDGSAMPPTEMIAPALVVTMFAGFMRAFYSALQRQADAGDREALLARTSRTLLGVTDREQAYSIVRQAAAALCELTAGLGLLQVRSQGEHAVVEHCFGLTESLVGLRLPTPAVLPGTDGHVLTRLDPDSVAELGAAVRGRQVFGMRLGADPELILLLTCTNRVPQEIFGVLHTLTAELALVEANCRSHAELFTLAHHDSLTTIANRASFFSRLTSVVDGAVGVEARVGLLVVDLDDFKTVNDTLGHGAGDRVLIEVANRMTELAGKFGTAARFGGDEFALLLTEVDDPGEVDRIAERLRDSLLDPIPWITGSIRVGASIGVTSGAQGATAGDLMRCADIAMYSAKALGKNRVVRFSDDQHGSIAHLRVLEEHLLYAIERDEIVLHYQPQVVLITGRCLGVEVLARWQHPTLGLLSPSVFIPLAERVGQIAELGEYILVTACQEVMRWPEPAVGLPLRLSVNVSARQLTGGGFARIVADALRVSGMAAERLTLEFTETDLIADRALVAPLAALRALGVRLALDDFGAGFASLANVRALAVRQLKIDRRLLGGDDPATHDDLVLMIMAVSQLLNLETVAEAVETAEHADWARSCGMELAQGNVFCPPAPASEVVAWLADTDWGRSTGRGAHSLRVVASPRFGAASSPLGRLAVPAGQPPGCPGALPAGPGP